MIDRRSLLAGAGAVIVAPAGGFAALPPSAPRAPELVHVQSYPVPYEMRAWLGTTFIKVDANWNKQFDAYYLDTFENSLNSLFNTAVAANKAWAEHHASTTRSIFSKDKTTISDLSLYRGDKHFRLIHKKMFDHKINAFSSFSSISISI